MFPIKTNESFVACINSNTTLVFAYLYFPFFLRSHLFTDSVCMLCTVFCTYTTSKSVSLGPNPTRIAMGEATTYIEPIEARASLNFKKIIQMNSFTSLIPKLVISCCVMVYYTTDYWLPLIGIVEMLHELHIHRLV